MKQPNLLVRSTTNRRDSWLQMREIELMHKTPVGYLPIRLIVLSEGYVLKWNPKRKCLFCPRVKQNTSPAKKARVKSEYSQRAYKEVHMDIHIGNIHVIACLLLHRLVCLAFCGQPDLFRRFTDHKNGRKYDNRALNLEWVTPSENTRRYFNNRKK